MNEKDPLLCVFFNTPPHNSIYRCDDCVSGPRVCTCTGQYACQTTGTNIMDVVPDVGDEDICLGLCKEKEGCLFYTWYGPTSAFSHICFLFNDCSEIDFSCSDCVSGPVQRE